MMLAMTKCWTIDICSFAIYATSMTSVEPVEKIYLELTTAAFLPVPSDPVLSASARIVSFPEVSYQSYKIFAIAYCQNRCLFSC